MKGNSALLVDVGTGNLHSVLNALQNLEYTIKVTSDPHDLLAANRVVLPGVGAFGKFMDGLRLRGLQEALMQYVEGGNPLLGICVGMQAFFEMGEEMGQFPGLGLLPGKVSRFLETSGIKVPHTGWNQLWPNADRPSPLLAGLDHGDYAYFNHSFYCIPADSTDIAATTDYGITFSSVVQRDLLFGVQFHPEKSQHVGLHILSNFMSQ
jgi:glutamine amidotransferase